MPTVSIQPLSLGEFEELLHSSPISKLIGTYTEVEEDDFILNQNLEVTGYKPADKPLSYHTSSELALRRKYLLNLLALNRGTYDSDTIRMIHYEASCCLLNPTVPFEALDKLNHQPLDITISGKLYKVYWELCDDVVVNYENQWYIVTKGDSFDRTRQGGYSAFAHSFHQNSKLQILKDFHKHMNQKGLENA